MKLKENLVLAELNTAMVTNTPCLVVMIVGENPLSPTVQDMQR